MIWISILVTIGLLILVLVMMDYPVDHSRYDLPLATPVIADEEISAAHDEVVRKLTKFVRAAKRDIHAERQRFEEFFTREVESSIVPVDQDGVRGEWVIAEGANPDRRLLYLHGGAFRIGSPISHRYITDKLSRLGGLAVLSVDYRMQPEFKIATAHEDARNAYRWILGHGPSQAREAEALFVAGDSAGGNLTLSVIAWARNEKVRPADGAIAFAPSTDATFSSPTLEANVNTDYFLGPAFSRIARVPRFLIRLLMRLGAGGSPKDPKFSPLLGDLSGLPDTLIQVSRDEMLYGDALRYANKANAQGTSVTLQVWPKLVHVFQGFPELPEAQTAYEYVGDFIRARLPG